MQTFLRNTHYGRGEVLDNRRDWAYLVHCREATFCAADITGGDYSGSKLAEPRLRGLWMLSISNVASLQDAPRHSVLPIPLKLHTPHHVFVAVGGGGAQHPHSTIVFRVTNCTRLLHDVGIAKFVSK